MRICLPFNCLIELQTLKEFADVVPLQVPAKGVGLQAVRVVLTSSEEDKKLLLV